MITIRVKKQGQKHDTIAHVKNDANCKKWLSLLSGDFDTIEIKHAKVKGSEIIRSKYELLIYLEK